MGALHASLSFGNPLFSAVIRFPFFQISEQELRSAMSSVVVDTVGHVVDWTSTVDERQVPVTIGFFVELVGDEGMSLFPFCCASLFISGIASDSMLTGERVLDVLSRSNENITRAFARGILGKPTIRIVERGTFSKFRQLKLDEGLQSLGQVKVPVVLPKAAYVTWFANQVVKEL